MLIRYMYKYLYKFSFFSTARHFNMSLSYLTDKNPRDFDVSQILKVFIDHDFDENTDAYKNIAAIVEKKELNGQDILDTPKTDLIKMLKLKDNEDIEKFETMRNTLRKAVFSKRAKIVVDPENVNTLNWDGLCQLLEQEIICNDTTQRQIWYSYIEKEGFNGANLVTDKKDHLIQVLSLTDGQKARLKKLLQKIQDDKNEAGINIINENSKIGAMATASGDGTFHMENMNITM